MFLHVVDYKKKSPSFHFHYVKHIGYLHKEQYHTSPTKLIVSYAGAEAIEGTGVHELFVRIS